MMTGTFGVSCVRVRPRVAAAGRSAATRPVIREINSNLSFLPKLRPGESLAAGRTGSAACATGAVARSKRSKSLSITSSSFADADGSCWSRRALIADLIDVIGLVISPAISPTIASASLMRMKSAPMVLCNASDKRPMLSLRCGNLGFAIVLAPTPWRS